MVEPFSSLTFSIAIEENGDAILGSWQALLARDHEFGDVVAGPKQLLQALAVEVRGADGLGDGSASALGVMIAELLGGSETIGVVACKLRCLAAAVDELAVPMLDEGARGGEAVRRLYRSMFAALESAARAAARDIALAAFHSPVTGLFNKNAYHRDIDRLAKLGRSFSVMYIDMDGLKALNDSQGHQAGDEALSVLGAQLSKRAGESDTVYHISGDEFIVMTQEAGDGYLAGFAESVKAEGGTNFSYGSASWPEEGAQPKAVEDLADSRMQAQKSERKRAGLAPERSS